MAKELEFGYRQTPLDFKVGPLSVATLGDLNEKIREVEDWNQIYQNWFYAPMQPIIRLGHEDQYEAPYPVRVFGLPKTHILRHDDDCELGHLQFHIWALSFFTGQRLSATEAGFLDATPMNSGALTDFVLLGDSMQKSVILAEAYWNKNTENRIQLARLEAAIHALFIAQNPKSLQYEGFLYLYTALDACFAILKETYTGSSMPRTHQERTSWMCNQFKIPVPAWADPTASTGAEVAGLRNPAIHEGLYMGQPMGFAIEGRGNNRNLNLEMQGLVCRLIVAIIGGSATEYVTSMVTSRQKIGLRLPLPVV